MRNGKAKKVAFGAISASLAAVILIVGSVLEILDMTSAAAASLVILAVLIEHGKKLGLGVYAASSVITFLIIPTSTSVIYYVLVIGYYPILKYVIEKKIKNRLLRLLPELAAFNAGCAAVLFVFAKLYGIDAVLAEFSVGKINGNAVFVLIFLLLNLFFFIYNYFLGAISLVYIRFLSPKYSKKFRNREIQHNNPKKY